MIPQPWGPLPVTISATCSPVSSVQCPPTTQAPNIKFHPSDRADTRYLHTRFRAIILYRGSPMLLSLLHLCPPSILSSFLPFFLYTQPRAFHHHHTPPNPIFRLQRCLPLPKQKELPVAEPKLQPSTFKLQNPKLQTPKRVNRLRKVACRRSTAAACRTHVCPVGGCGGKNEHPLVAATP
ncbi:hypothetical protein BZA05DRAFT_400198 [Tricharina praecox]|uniref:uncharacterized protein n=1 Tax=Tricharina praecox TaxID=43433 RepID=UPI0022202598|nr:uncharacterized protein BZA05DRAFT_400198 [Tricharina praecox]KAI5850760.1 hypothetical protein BZA05DRAFT_400198 [Tricharina praecox]